MYSQICRPGTRTPQASDEWIGLSGVRGMLLFVAFPWRGTTETSEYSEVFLCTHRCAGQGLEPRRSSTYGSACPDQITL
jgi:hypothetical protein